MDLHQTEQMDQLQKEIQTVLQPDAVVTDPDSQQQADIDSITYYTDPLCCWSWIFEPEWKKLVAHFGNTVTRRYCMGGLLPGWKNFYDTVNSIHKPLQMGPMWMHASKISGIAIRDDLWAKDPPASSYPACVAVKAAALQSDVAAEKYLFLLRDACMMQARNIAKPSVLLELADDLCDDETLQFDPVLFKKHLFGNEGKEAFKKDLQEVRYYGINRFPSIVIKARSGNAKLITGYNKYETLVKL